MFLWVETQPTVVIALLVFACCYLVAAIVFLGIVLVTRWPIAPGLRATSPTMLSALGVIIGLVIAFVASHVWSNITSAEEQVVREASAIRDVVLLSDALPDELRTRVRAGVRTYLDFVEREDWPAMSAGRANLRRPPPGLSDAMKDVLTDNLSGSGQQVAQQRIIVAIQQALEARRHRILLSEASIEPSQWFAILTLTVLMLVTIGLVHIHHLAAAANLFIFSSALAACVVLLMVSDRPFSAGGITLQPTALREVEP